jgi:predicted transcriptional regulator of viral defense system
MNDNNQNRKCESLSQWVQSRLISGKSTFTLEEAMSATSLRRSSLALALHRLKVRKLIVSPMRGFYVCMPDRYQLRGDVPPVFYVDDLMRHLGRNYYLGLTSSAAIWGAGHQRIQGDYAVVTLPRMSSGGLARGMLRFVYRKQMPEAHIVTRNADGGVVRFADAALTAFDLVQHADLVGGMSSAATIVSELIDEMDFTSLSDLGEVVPCVVWQRLGYICEEVVGASEKADALYHTWRSLGLRIVNTPLSPFERNRGGELNRRWHVKINLEIEVDDL